MQRPLQDIDPAARALIRHKVNRLIGRYGYRENDRDDLSQELAIHALVAGTRFDPSRATAGTFYESVLSKKSVCLIRERTAQKRGWDRIEHGDPDIAVAQVSSRLRIGSHPLQVEIREVLHRLPADLQTLADLLVEQNLAQAGKTLGLTRQQARTRRDVIAEYFRGAGFGPETKYSFRLPTHSSSKSVNRYQRRAPMTGHKVEAVTAPQRSCAHAA